MVALVLVSHSADLAAAVRALAEQQAQGRVPMAAVGGTGDPEQPFGTDAVAILAAMESVYSDDGVLVLMDLGTAIMSAETALEFMDPAKAAHVVLAAAPFVEGALAACVQASIGAGLEAVAAEARAALAPKQESLGEQAPAVSPVPLPLDDEPASTPSAVIRLLLPNPAGLHLGPAALFVQAAAAFSAAIEVRNLTTGAGPADARRFNQVLGLGAEQHHALELHARGVDAAAAIAALAALVGSGFGEARHAAPAPASASAAADPALPAGQGSAVLHGSAGAPGAAVGVAFVWPTADIVVAARTVDDPAAEWDRFRSAAEVAHRELEDLAAFAARNLGPQQSRIFQAHLALLSDPDLNAAVQHSIAAERAGAETAVDSAYGAAAAQVAAMASPRFQERAADIRDVRSRLLRLLAGAAAADTPALPDHAVIVADDLAPSQTARLGEGRVAAICTAAGGPTAHTAILARSLGIPAVVGLGPALLAQARNGRLLAVDGTAGRVVVEPDAATAAAYRQSAAGQAAARQAAQAAAQAPAHTRDGRRVHVAANLGRAEEVQAALDAGAEGVGLLRSEFLFHDRALPPGEEEQAAAYLAVAAAMQPRPVTIRTLDIGGDKPAPYLPLPAEANPYLGWRGIRVSLAMPDLFKTQLRAILRAGAHGNVRVMFPMVAALAEVEEALALLAEAKAELSRACQAGAGALPVGVMIEVPAAVEMADQLAQRVDFFSIGSNDLAQYTFAADRGNARVAGLGDALHPAVLRQVARVIDAAHAQGKWVALCGELAGRPEAIPILLGLHLDEFSMAPAALPGAKALLARLSLPAAEELAHHALHLPDAAAVHAAVAAFLQNVDE